MSETPERNGEAPNAGKPAGGTFLMRSHGQLQPAAPQAALNLWALLRALRRRLAPALVVGLLLAGIVGTVVWFVIPTPKKTVRSLLHMSAAQPHVFFKSGEGQQFDLYQRSQIALLKSRFVLNIALGTEEVKNLEILKQEPDPVQWLEKELRADFSLGPELLRISMEGDDGKPLEAIVNAVTKAYLDEIVNKERTKKLVRLDTLKDLARKFEEKVAGKRLQLKELANAADVGTNKSEVLLLKQQFAANSLALARTELTTLRSEVRKLQVKLDLMGDRPSLAPEYSAMLYGSPGAGFPINLVLVPVLLEQQLKASPHADGDVPESFIEEWFKQDLIIKKYAKRTTDLAAWIESFKRVAENKDKKTPSPVLIARQNELAHANKSVEERRQALRPKAIEEIRHKAQLTAQNSLYRLRREKASLQRLEEMIQDDVKKLAQEGKRLSDSNLKVDDLNADIKRWETTADNISHEIDALEVERQAPERVTEFEKAVVYAPSKNARQLMMTAVASLGSLGLVLFAFAWFELRCRKVDSADEVVRNLGITLMGTLPNFNRSRPRWLPARDADLYFENHLVNSVDAVRTTVLFAAREERLKAVLVTSAVSGEGKTSSASHLSASLARTGRRTVLVDCDLRNPSAHRLFELSRGPGFSELLRGENTLAEVIRPASVDGLFIITAGQGDLEAIQALSQDKLGPIFEGLRAQFDFIIIDSSPILPVPDALLIAQYADGVIFSILREVSRVPKILAAYHRLAFLQIRILGAVVSGTTDEAYGGSGYHYGYGYGMPAKAEASKAETAPPDTGPDQAN